MVELTLHARLRPQRQQLHQPLMWYDHVNKQMWTSTGGVVGFRYDPQERRMKPVAQEARTSVLRSDFNTIVDWVRKNQHRLEIEYVSPGRSATVLVEESDLDELVDDLVRHGIYYSY